MRARSADYSDLVKQAERSSSQNLYILSDLAQYVIKAYADRRNWTIDTFPGGVRMPGDIFKPLPSKEIAAEVRRRRLILHLGHY